MVTKEIEQFVITQMKEADWGLRNSIASMNTNLNISTYNMTLLLAKRLLFQ